MIEEEQIKHSTIVDAAKEIARQRGYSEQSRQLIEEMAELTIAINKLYRAMKHEGTTEEIENAAKDICEEIADVEIVMVQVKYLLQIPEEAIYKVKEEKVLRELSRIIKGK